MGDPPTSDKHVANLLPQVPVCPSGFDDQGQTHLLSIFQPSWLEQSTCHLKSLALPPTKIGHHHPLDFRRRPTSGRHDAKLLPQTPVRPSGFDGPDQTHLLSIFQSDWLEQALPVLQLWWV